MRKTLLLSLIGCLLCCSANVFSATRYEQRVVFEEDTTWKGEVIVSAGILVPMGRTLTLEPGTKITFMKKGINNSFEIRGRLICKGTADSPIIITSDFVKPASWPGMIFFTEGERAENTPTSELIHTRIMYAVTAIDLERHPIIVDNCEIIKAETGLKIAANSLARVSNTTFESIRKQAVKIEQTSQLELFRSIIRFCKDGITGSGDYRMLIEECTFERNEQAIFISSTYPNNQILSSRFSNNQYAVKLERRTRAQISGNRFEGNEYGIYLNNQSAPEITNNIFTENKKAITAIRMSEPLIRQNEMYGNEIAIASFLGSYPKINYNNIYDNQTAIYLRFVSADWNQQAGLSKDLSVYDATKNWWGEKMSKLIAAKGNDFNRPDIFDGHDVPYNQDRGRVFIKQKVNYDQWLTKKLEIALLTEAATEPKKAGESK